MAETPICRCEGCERSSYTILGYCYYCYTHYHDISGRHIPPPRDSRWNYDKDRGVE